MERNPEVGEHIRHTVVWQPTAVGNSSIPQQLERLLRVTHPENFGAQPKRFDRLDQELAQFGCAFVVTPITNPDQIAVKMAVTRGAKNVCVGRLVPCPSAPSPATVPIDIAQQIAVGEHAVVM